MFDRIAIAVLAAALCAVAPPVMAQANPADIRARDDAERAQRNYRDSLRDYDAAVQRDRDARIRNQMLPEPGPVPPGTVHPDPAQRIQVDDAARLRQWQADQAKRDAEAAERAARDARERARRR